MLLCRDPEEDHTVAAEVVPEAAEALAVEAALAADTTAEVLTEVIMADLAEVHTDRHITEDFTDPISAGAAVGSTDRIITEAVAV